MQFNSYIFVLIFLPVVVFLYQAFMFKNKKAANFLLFVASVVFYGYAAPKGMVLLLFSIICNYVINRLMVFKYECLKYRQTMLIVGIGVNIVILAYFKYYNFLVDTSNMILKTDLGVRDIFLPLGISFITFQQIAFLVDTYRGEMKECKLLDYSLFVSFFPHVTSGPILQHGDFFPVLESRGKHIDWDRLATGIYMFVMGLSKKVLIADMFAKAVDWGYGNISVLNTTSALFVSVAYSIQIYFDFSGYSDMAIGISRMLGLDLPINFNSPYKARTISEFWDRWHMSLTRFLTKYLYISLGGSRKGTVRTYINIILVFLCSGIWHGANWTFIIWGMLHGVFMVICRGGKKFVEKVPGIINHIITLAFVNFTWILFRAGSFSAFKQMISAIFQNQWGELNSALCECFKPTVVNSLFKVNVPYWGWAVGALCVTGFMILGCKNVQERAEKMKYSAWSVGWVLLLVIMCIFSFSGVSTFVYADF